MCLSVRLSQVGSYTKTDKRRIMRTIPHSSLGILASDANDLGEIKMGYQQRRRQIQLWWVKIGCLDLYDFYNKNISPYISETVQDSDSYYGTLIGTRMHSIKRCYFQ